MLNYLELQRLIRNPRPLGANDVNQRNPQGGFPQWTRRVFEGISDRTQGSLRRFSEIGAAADFPESPEVGDLYEVTAAVTDPVTALDFENGDIIYWNGTTWRTLRTKISLDNPAQIKGVITVDGDFTSIPVPDERIEGWVYRCPVGNPTPVTDNTVAPPQTFQPGDEFLWIGDGSTNWINLGPGSATALAYDNSGSGLVAANVQDAIDEVAGGSGGGGGIFTFPEILFVGPGSPGAADDADLNTPFVTIQGALDTIGIPADPADFVRRFIVIVATGVYDEDLVVPAGRLIQLLAMGPVVLGDGSQNWYDSATPRNITWNLDDALELVPDKQRPTLILGPALAPIGAGATIHNAYGSEWFVSGSLIPTLLGAAGTNELALTNVRLARGIDGSGAVGAGINTYIDRIQCGRINPVPVPPTTPTESLVINAPSMRLIYAHECLFGLPYGSQGGHVQVQWWNRIIRCNFRDGFTPSGGSISDPELGRAGMYLTEFVGTYTAGGTLPVDGVTNHSIKATGAIGGGAAKTIISDLTP